MIGRRIIVQIGKYKDYMKDTKFRAPAKYKAIKALGGVENYINKFIRNQYLVSEIYYELKENPDMSISDFYRKHGTNLYKSRTGFSLMLHSMSFKQYEGVPQVVLYDKMNYIIEAFKKYKEKL